MTRNRGSGSKVDANQAEIVAALIKAGCSVQSLATVGEGCPDLLVGVAGENILLEVKDGTLVPSQRELTPKQKAWHRRWEGTAHLAYSAAEALAIVKYVRRKNGGAR